MTVLDQIPKAIVYALMESLNSKGRRAHLLKEVSEGEIDRDEGVFVQYSAHEQLRRDMAVAIELREAAIEVLVDERNLLNDAHLEYENLLETVLENHDNAQWPENTPANDALDAWRKKREGNREEADNRSTQ